MGIAGTPSVCTCHPGYSSCPSSAMAKSKNHTGHNQNYKNHRNGIKKTRRSKKLKIDGNMNCKFVRNMKAVNKGMECSAAEKEERKQQQREAQKELEEKRKA